MADYEAAGITGVTEDNLAAVNAAILAEDTGGADTVAEIQADVAEADAALAKIEAYNNGDGVDPAALTVADYEAAGITGVTEDNLAAVNLFILAEDTGGADSVAEIQANVAEADLALAAPPPVISSFTINDGQLIDSSLIPALATTGYAGTTVNVEDGQLVTVLVNGISSTTEVSGGSFSGVIDLSSLEAQDDGVYSATANVTNFLGDAAPEYSVNLLKDAIARIDTLVISDDDLVNQLDDPYQTVAFTGTTTGIEFGQMVPVAVGNVLATASVQGDGSFSGTIDLSGTDDFFGLAVTANSEDLVGNTAVFDSTITIDKTAGITIDPEASLVGIGADGISSAAENDNVIISGTVEGIEAGQMVTITISTGGDNRVLTAEVQADNTWTAESIDIQSFLATTVQIDATVTDLQGNTTNAVSTFVHDNVNPYFMTLPDRLDQTALAWEFNAAAEDAANSGRWNSQTGNAVFADLDEDPATTMMLNTAPQSAHPGITQSYIVNGAIALQNANTGALTSGRGNRDSTYEIWFKTSGPVTGNQVIFETGNNSLGLVFWIDDTNIYIAGAGISRSYDYITAGVDPSAEFVQVVFGFDQNAGSSREDITAYVNGVRLGITNTLKNSGFANNDAGGLGGVHGSGAAGGTNTVDPTPFSGEIAILRVLTSRPTVTSVLNSYLDVTTAAANFQVPDSTVAGAQIFDFNAADNRNNANDTAVSYRLSGTGAENFALDSDTGILSVATGVTLVAADQFTLTVTVTDLAGNSSAHTFVLEVTAAVPPIVIDLDGDGIEYAEQANLQLDLDGDGTFEHLSAWINPDDGLLAYDANGNGLIDSGAEFVFTGYLPGATTDLEGLRAFDTNADGALTRADAKFDAFYVWQDRNQDGIGSEDELTTLIDLGVAAVHLDTNGQTQVAGSGVYEFGQGTIVMEDGTTLTFGDTSLSYKDAAPTDTSRDLAVMLDEYGTGMAVL